MLENMLNACDEYDVDISICAREYCFDDNEIDVFQNTKDYNSIVMSGKEAFRHFLLEDIDGFVVAWNKLYKKNYLQIIVLNTLSAKYMKTALPHINYF